MSAEDLPPGWEWADRQEWESQNSPVSRVWHVGLAQKPSILYKTSFDRDDPEYAKQVEEFYQQALTALRRLTAPEEWLWMVTGSQNYFDDYADDDYCVWVRSGAARS